MHDIGKNYSGDQGSVCPGLGKHARRIDRITLTELRPRSKAHTTNNPKKSLLLGPESKANKDSLWNQLSFPLKANII